MLNVADVAINAPMVCVSWRAAAAGIMISDPASNAPRNRRPERIVSPKSNKNQRLRRLTFIPVAEASSGENKPMINLFRSIQTAIMTKRLAASPNTNSLVGKLPKPPKSASISSSVELIRSAPMATELAKITPIVASVESSVFFSRCQMIRHPIRSVNPPPIRGLMLQITASPSPGMAICDITSPARTVRFISAKLPITPAAAAAEIARMNEYVSFSMFGNW